MTKRASSSMEVLLGLLTSRHVRYDWGRPSAHRRLLLERELWADLSQLKMLRPRVCDREDERQKGKPERHIYSITKRGGSGWRVAGGRAAAEIPRNELLLKLFFGAQVPAEILIVYVEEMVGKERRWSRSLSKQQGGERQQQFPIRLLVDAARYGQLELEAHLRWAKRRWRSCGRSPGSRGVPRRIARRSVMRTNEIREVEASGTGQSPKQIARGAPGAFY